MASLGDSIAKRSAFVAQLEDVTGPTRGRVVLDLGCGDQALWTRAYVGRGAHVVAVELDARRLRAAAERLRAAAPEGDGRVLGIVRATGERLPLEAASVALIHCAQVLEHVASPETFLGEIRRVLIPGGHCYLTAINRYALRDPHFGVIGVNYLPARLADRILDAIGATNPEGQSLSAMHYFSRRGFRRLCATCGLDVIADLKRTERLTRHGALGGRLADLWGSTVRSAAFHWLVARPQSPRRSSP